MSGFASGRFVYGDQAPEFDLFGNRRYGTVLADPPWRFDTYSDKGRGRSADWIEREEALPLLGVEESVSAEKHYPTMPTADICALPVGDIAADDCALYLWGTLNMLPDALAVVSAWGFTHKTARIWAKTAVAGFDPARTLEQNFPMGTGYIVRGNPEILLIATRGKPRFAVKPRALIIAPRREHSRKPDCVRRDIERASPGPRIELFARQAAPGWSSWGNQTDRFDAPANPAMGERQHEHPATPGAVF